MLGVCTEIAHLPGNKESSHLYKWLENRCKKLNIGKAQIKEHHMGHFTVDALSGTRVGKGRNPIELTIIQSPPPKFSYSLY